MRTSFAACASALLIAAAPPAQNQPLDLSGRWQLVEPTSAERALDTLDITSPDELVITQTRRAIIVEHPSKSGTHPEARTFVFGVGGVVGGLPGRGSTIDEQWSVAYTGTQLMITRSTRLLADRAGVPVTLARGSMWRLEPPNRLAIEFSEELTGERPKIAIRVYARMTPP
jgi:hypothetical protein